MSAPSIIAVSRITRDRYNQMAEAVVPVWWDPHGFLMGEPLAHRICHATNDVLPTYRGFVTREHHGAVSGPPSDYYEFAEPITIPEWRRIDPENMVLTAEGEVVAGSSW